MKKIHFYGILWILIGIFGISTTFSALINFTENESGYKLDFWKFFNDGKWNAGTIDMTGAWRNENSIEWNIRLQSVGGANFQNAKILIPNGNPTRMCWKLSGEIVSKNAGNIQLADNFGAELRYNPITTQLEGYGFSKNLGKVWLGMDEYCKKWEDKITDEILEDIRKAGKIPGERAAFIGKVKIIGALGGKNSVSSTVYQMWKNVNIETANYNTFLQEIRKNAFILSRNISPSQKNENFSLNNAQKIGDKIFYINSGKTTKTLKITAWPKGVRSIILIGGDAVISENIEKTDNPLAIIALQNEEKQGGNIFITENVTKIVSSLLAEKSLFSGEGKDAGAKAYYNDDKTEVTRPPKNQLYIFGTVFARNTIGGASDALRLEDVICPVGANCINPPASAYDLNYFRAFDVRDMKNNTAKRGYKDATLDEYSLIIEHDSRTQLSPPPWLENIR